MNYRHAFHAGNFADVVKHVALVAILEHLKKKNTPFAIIDTHAGRGLYDLGSDEAARTRESDSGIRRLYGLADGPLSLITYVNVVRGLGERIYPGSPLIAARLKRPVDRLVAIEKHPEEQAELARALRPYAKAQAMLADGYAQLAALLPPPERRGLILIDPPYESPSEVHDTARAVRSAHRRFATGIYLVWFPEKSESEVNRFCGEVMSGGLERVLRVDFQTASNRSSGDGRLSAAGLLVINSPFGFEQEMRAALAILEPLLGESPNARARGRITILGDGSG
jgi:23S rRNA (adenine2030-N6)-methyltransferase